VIVFLTIIGLARGRHLVAIISEKLLGYLNFRVILGPLTAKQNYREVRILVDEGYWYLDARRVRVFIVGCIAKMVRKKRWHCIV
jgi:hypothetical protein